MIPNFMNEKLIIKFNEYLDTVEKLALVINENYKPTVLVGIMRGAAPIIDILSRILKLPTAYIVIQSYSGSEIENRLEQLRALDNNISIMVALAKSSPIGIDTKEDYIAIKKIMEYKS